MITNIINTTNYSVNILDTIANEARIALDELEEYSIGLDTEDIDYLTNTLNINNTLTL